MDNKKTLEKKAGLLHLRAISLAAGMKSGSFRSLYKGQGVEFSGVRDYLPGDDVRSIDWNVTARMGRPFIKLFEEERELSVLIVVDASLSMDCGSGAKTRLGTAAECASLLALAAEQNRSPVGAVVFSGEATFSCPPRTGRAQTLLILSKFDELGNPSEERSGGTALGSALNGAGRLLKKKSLVMVISDFRAASWDAPLASLCQKNDVVAVRISDPEDEALPSVGSVPFSDAEGRLTLMLPTSSQEFRKKWRDSGIARSEEWKKKCRRCGCIPLEISTNSDPGAELQRFFSAREARW